MGVTPPGWPVTASPCDAPVTQTDIKIGLITPRTYSIETRGVLKTAITQTGGSRQYKKFICCKTFVFVTGSGEDKVGLS